MINENVIKKEIDQEFSLISKGEIYRYIIGDVEKILIERALESTSGNQILAAKMLGINRNTIRKKIRKSGIKITQFRI